MVIARGHRLAIEVALLALVAYLTARGISDAVRVAVDGVPPPSAGDTVPPAVRPAALEDYALIAERDIFNPSPGSGTRAATPSGLRLWGVALQGREARAVIEDAATHRQDLYRVGDAVGGTRVAAIDWDRVTLAGPDGETTLELGPPAGALPTDDGAPDPAADAAGARADTVGTHVRDASAPSRDQRIRRTGENAFLVDRRELAGAVDNMSGLLTELRAVAEVRDGRPAGFRLFEIRDGSLFARLGLHDGDVVQRVNGSPIADPAALLAFLQRLRTEPRVALDIVRRDAPRTIVYDLR